MTNSLDINIASQYKSMSQKIRISTEAWVQQYIFCPNCGNHITKYENNKPVADFFCTNCNEEYELKSKKGTFGKTIVDGAYKTMLERLNSKTNPNLFLLNYTTDSYVINNFVVVPKHFFVKNIINKRNPLAKTARRAGWVGCNINLGAIPHTGKIYYIKNGSKQDTSSVLNNWKQFLFIRNKKNEKDKGWIFDIINCIDNIGTKTFSLRELYSFESFLKIKHPENKHIKAKIRQQLQILRNNGYLTFISKGQYRLI